MAREPAAGVARSRARERRREGRSKTFDWAEFRPIAQALAQQRAQEAEGLQADASEPERSRRREERRKRYESVTSSEHRSSTEGGSVPDSLSPISLERQQRVEEVIEEHWRQVEKTPIREERRVPLASTTPATRDTAELELLLDSYKQGVRYLCQIYSPLQLGRDRGQINISLLEVMFQKSFVFRLILSLSCH